MNGGVPGAPIVKSASLMSSAEFPAASRTTTLRRHVELSTPTGGSQVKTPSFGSWVAMGIHVGLEELEA